MTISLYDTFANPQSYYPVVFSAVCWLSLRFEAWELLLWNLTTPLNNHPEHAGGNSQRAEHCSALRNPHVWHLFHRILPPNLQVVNGQVIRYCNSSHDSPLLKAHMTLQWLLTSHVTNKIILQIDSNLSSYPKASVLMLRLSYATETVLSNKVTRNRIVV